MSLNIYKVIFHYESATGYENLFDMPSAPGNVARTGNQQDIQAHVGAAANDYETIVTVLKNNGYTPPAGSLIVLDSISNEGPGTVIT